MAFRATFHGAGKNAVLSMSSTAEKSVLTIATAKKSYYDMAVNLARSFKRWHPEPDIEFYIVTDLEEPLPSDLAWVRVIRVKPLELGSGFSTKLHLDKLAKTSKTLFIDADCLCVGRLDKIFEGMSGKPVGVIGRPIADGEWFGDVAEICRKFEVATIPYFNGGIYYFEKSEIGNRIYQFARELEPKYSELGLILLRGRPNDELLISIGMAINGVTPVWDGGTMMSDPQFCPLKMRLDSLGGGASLTNPPRGHPKHYKMYPEGTVHPAVVHFLGGITSDHPYTREALRLKVVCGQGKSKFVGDLLAFAKITLPVMVKRSLKGLLRPVYQFLFGARPIKKSDRL